MLETTLSQWLRACDKLCEPPDLTDCETMAGMAVKLEAENERLHGHVRYLSDKRVELEAQVSKTRKVLHEVCVENTALRTQIAKVHRIIHGAGTSAMEEIDLIADAIGCKDDDACLMTRGSDL